MGATHPSTLPIESTCSQPNFEFDFLACLDRFLTQQGLREEYDVLSPPIGHNHYCEVRHLLNCTTGEVYIVKTYNCSLLSAHERDFLVSSLRFSIQQNHPNILSCLQVFQDETDFVCAIFEQFEGQLLDEYISDIGTRPSPFVVYRVIKQVSSVLKHLREQKIDLSVLDPSQILFNGSVVKLYNFESCLTPQKDAPALSAFSAPEVLLRCRSSSKSNVWALGVLSYYLFTGFQPFAGDTIIKTIESIVANKPRMPIDHLLVTEDAQALLQGLLASNPIHRLTLDKIDATKFMSDQNNAYYNHLGRVLQMMDECLRGHPPPTQIETALRILYLGWTQEQLLWLQDVVDVFHHIDAKGVGRITKEDIICSTKDTSLQPFQSMLNSIFDTWAANNTFLPLLVFTGVFLKAFTHEMPKNTIQFARSFRTTNDGSISKEGLQSRINLLHPTVRRFVHLPEHDFVLTPQDIPAILYCI